jgi:hypothetical protein
MCISKLLVAREHINNVQFTYKIVSQNSKNIYFFYSKSTMNLFVIYFIIYIFMYQL